MDASVLIVIILMILAAYTSIKEQKLVEFKTNKKDYLNSNEWKNMRQIILQRDNHKCVVCGTTNNLDIHHITYERVGDEELDDLVTVCRIHHNEIHNKYGYDYSSKFPVIYQNKLSNQMTDYELDVLLGLRK